MVVIAGALLGELSERKVMGGGDEGKGAVRSELDVLEAEESEPGEDDGGEGEGGILLYAPSPVALCMAKAETRCFKAPPFQADVLLVDDLRESQERCRRLL